MAERPEIVIDVPAMPEIFRYEGYRLRWDWTSIRWLREPLPPTKTHQKD